MELYLRDNGDEEAHAFVNPYTQLNVGLWLLFIGATAFLGLRVWVKVNWRHGLWYDDWILIISWMVLLANNSLIVHEFRTGYVLQDSEQSWGDRMHILINVSSCGTLIGQAWTKTAFGVTLLRISNRWQQAVLWFCIVTMNIWMVLKVVFQWARVCDKDSYDNWYRLDFCIGWKFRDDFKEGGNVYNIIMDFMFATFPWLIFRRLEMRRIEKIGLSITMSLGILVAIVSAIRVAWKDDGNERDKWYIWRNGLSQVWYSSEITGTILVQCIPILRTVLRDMHSSFRSKRRASTADGNNHVLPNKFNSQRVSSVTVNHGNLKAQDRLELRAISEDMDDVWIKDRVSSELDSGGQDGVDRTSDYPSWLRGPSSPSAPNSDIEQGKMSRSSTRDSMEEPLDQGLWPPPR